MKKRFLILILLCFVAFVCDILFGSVNISLAHLWESLVSQEQPIYREIIINYRLPKAFTALFVGASLAVAGLLMQILFRNPLAGPDVLGINSGASLGVALLTLGGASFPFFVSSAYAQVVAAILGASLILMLILLASTRVKSTLTLLIVGVMFGYFTSSIVSILQNMSNPETLKLFITWTFGSLSAVGWNELVLLCAIQTTCLFFAFLLIKQLNVFLLGSEYAKGLGISVERTRFYIIVITAVLAGTATAFTGPIGFIGITVPHIARGLFKTSNIKVILPASVLCGATILMGCDIVSQLPLFNGVLPINAVTSLFGAPIILWILARSKA